MTRTNLYSVCSFRTLESTTQSGRPELAHDANLLAVCGEMTTDALLLPLSVRELAENASEVIALTMRTDTGRIPVIAHGLRITRLPDWRMNRVVYDEHAKEYVIVTNGSCLLDHSSADAFRASHNSTDSEYMSMNGHCLYRPSEAIALRPVIMTGGKVVLAYTHRGVDPCMLRAVSSETEQSIKASFDAVMSKRRSKTWIGRI